MTANVMPSQKLLSSRVVQSLRSIALVSAIVVVAGISLSPDRMWANWLLVSYYAVTLGLGGVCLVAIHYVTGSTWSVAIRRIPEGLSTLVPVAAVGLGVVFLVRPELYVWTMGDFGSLPESALAFKRWWLDWSFFLIRAVGYIVLWTLFAWAIRKQSHQQDTNRAVRHTIMNRRLSAVFLVVLAFSFSLAAFDWVMSLEPAWFSTIFAVYNFAGLFLSTLACVILLVIWLEGAGPLAGVLTDEHLHDLGKLLFAFSTFWAYIWFSQYMLIWYSNITEETVYFITRTHGPWLGFFVLNLVLNWLVPFALLLRRDMKRHRRVMVLVAVVVLLGRWVDLSLMIFPPVVGEMLPSIWEVGAVAGAASLVILWIARALASVPIVPVGDPQLPDSLHYHQ